MIILYSQASCPQCKMVHTLLDNNKIEYEECQDMAKMQELGINHTPMLSVDGKLLQGRDIFNFINGRK